MIIDNNLQAASVLKHWFAQRPDLVPVFDLDGVILDAGHRIDLLPCGTLDLDKYRANTTAENVALDRDLPLISVVHWLNAANRPYHVATARVLCEHTRARLAASHIRPVMAMGRNGHTDHRGDALLKVSHFEALIPPDQLARHVLIDDLVSNCIAAERLGMLSVNVITEYTHQLQIAK